MPKGGRKGGTIFPRITLHDALIYAKKLVAKTHVSPQPQDVIYAGVVGAKGPTGNIKISALKRYGLMDGDNKELFVASALAKKIVAAPPEELEALYRQAALEPSVFKAIFNTYHGDTVSKAKLAQRASDLKVHPEQTETCVNIYVSALSLAKLVSVEGDKVTHVSDTDANLANPTENDEQSEDNIEDGDALIDRSGGGHVPREGSGDDISGNGELSDKSSDQNSGIVNTFGPKAVFHVNVTLDSSLDIDKLQKQPEILKKYGAV